MPDDAAPGSKAGCRGIDRELEFELVESGKHLFGTRTPASDGQLHGEPGAAPSLDPECAQPEAPPLRHPL